MTKVFTILISGDTMSPSDRLCSGHLNPLLTANVLSCLGILEHSALYNFSRRKHDKFA